MDFWIGSQCRSFKSHGPISTKLSKKLFDDFIEAHLKIDFEDDLRFWGPMTETWPNVVESWLIDVDDVDDDVDCVLNATSTSNTWASGCYWLQWLATSEVYASNLAVEN